MQNNNQKISACLVVYNEEKIIRQCLDSIKDFVDEIILVHDGECADKTLEIAKEYTNKIFVRKHAGTAESHRAFALSQTAGDWILQIDGDEYLDVADHDRIREMVENCPAGIDGYIFKWEMWNGKHAVYFKGLQKMCFMRKDKFHYIDVPQAVGWVDGHVKQVDLFLHHRPKYDNIAWKSFWAKTNNLLPIHARYFFPSMVQYSCFNTEPSSWLAEVKKIKSNYFRAIVWYPLKNCLGQLKNGLWSNRFGINLALQQYVYYFLLYWRVWKLSKKS